MKLSISAKALALSASLLAATTLLVQPASAQTFSDDQRQQIEGIVKDYLMKHPELIQDVMSALDKKQQEADAAKATATIKDNNATLFNSPHQVVLGNPQGKVQIVEFFDYNCGF
jgi:protein-disulfide isomerase